MKNKDLMQKVVELWGEESQKDMISENCLRLAIAIKELKKIDRKEDNLAYSVTYNKVCERIADMKISLDQAEFLFNTDSINQHYNYKLKDLEVSIIN